MSSTNAALEDIDFGVLPPEGIEIPGFHDHLARIRETTGVARIWNRRDWPAYAITRYEDVKAALLDQETFSPRATQEALTFPFIGRNLLGLEGRDHARHRKLVSGTFRSRRIARLVEPMLRPQAHAIVDEFAADGEADLMADFAKKYPMAIINRLLGIPTDEWEEMSSWARDIILATDEPERRRRAAASFAAFLRPLLDMRRKHPRDDLLSAIARAEIDGGRLPDEEVMAFMLLLFPAGVDTTWLALGSLLTGVLSTPGAKERLLAEPETRSWAAEETLRWESPIAMQPRITIRDTTVGGVSIPAGSYTLLCLSSANRDPARFPDPDRWRLDRRPVGHIAFGYGEHFCLGAHLARAELTTAIGVLLERLPGLALAEKPRFVGGSIRGPEAVRVYFDSCVPSTGSGTGCA